MRVALLAASLSVLLACSTGTGLARCDDTRAGGVICARLGEELELRLGETGYIADTRFAVRADAVPEDSRCPQNAVCVWAGNARVSLTLRDGTNSAAVDLSSTLEPHGAIRWGYEVRLVDVRPTPMAGQPIAPASYVIRLVVSRAPG
jgi:hypothetical protein